MSKIVFVIGAGASKIFNFPLGSELSSNIANDLRTLHIQSQGVQLGNSDQQWKEFEACLSNSHHNIEKFKELARKLSMQIPLAPSIDSYIANANVDEKLIAKLMILKQLLQCEKRAHVTDPKVVGKFDSLLGTINFNNSQKNLDFSKLQKCWHMDFFRSLVGTFKFEELNERFSDFGIINFNYDRIFEHFLFYALMARYQVNEQDAAAALDDLKVTRPYGKLGNLPWQHGNNIVPFGSELRDLNNSLQLAESIKTVSEGMDSNKVPMDLILENSTKKVVFLGFGFGVENLHILPKPTKGWRDIYSTCFGFSERREKTLRQKLAPFSNFGGQGSGEIYTFRGSCEDLLFEYSEEIFA